MTENRIAHPAYDRHLTKYTQGLKEKRVGGPEILGS